MINNTINNTSPSRLMPMYMSPLSVSDALGDPATQPKTQALSHTSLSRVATQSVGSFRSVST
jgi:hypothetical protein